MVVQQLLQPNLVFVSSIVSHSGSLLPFTKVAGAASDCYLYKDRCDEQLHVHMYLYVCICKTVCVYTCLCEHACLKCRSDNIQTYTFKANCQQESPSSSTFEAHASSSFNQASPQDALALAADCKQSSSGESRSSSSKLSSALTPASVS